MASDVTRIEDRWLAGGVIGNVANLDSAEFRRAAEVVVVRDQYRAGLRRVGLELERAGADRLVGETISSKRLVRLLADDVSAGVVGDTGKEDSR